MVTIIFEIDADLPGNAASAAPNLLTQLYYAL